MLFLRYKFYLDSLKKINSLERIKESLKMYTSNIYFYSLVQNWNNFSLRIIKTIRIFLLREFNSVF